MDDGGARGVPVEVSEDAVTLLVTRPKQVIERQEVSARLDHLHHARAVEVVGPAGSGKTSSVRAWSDRSQIGVVAWLTVRPDHRDGLVLARALAERVAEVLPLRLEPVHTEPSGLVESMIEAIDRSGRRAILVIDNAEELAEAPSLEVIRQLISTTNDPLRFVIIGRTMPDVGFEELRSVGDLVTIAANQLRLDADETSRIVRSIADRQVADEDVAAIHRGIDGWAMGAVLAGLALNTASDPSSVVDGGVHSHRYFDHYFGSRVFDELPSDVQAFLLDTCMLDRLDPALCTELSERPDAERILRSLESSNVFTEWLGGDPPVFQYHPVLRTWMRARLALTQPHRPAELLFRAADWCQRHGHPADAIGYRLRAGDHEMAADLIVECGPRAMGEGRYEAVRAWVRSLPDEVVASSGPLLILLADAEHRLGHAEGAAAAWALARDLVEREPGLAMDHHELVVAVQRGTEAHRCGHLVTAAAHARHSVSLLDLTWRPSDVGSIGFSDTVLAMSVASLASQLLFAGHLSECSRLSAWVVDTFPAHDPMVATARARCLGQRAIVEVLDGSRLAAETTAREAIALCRFHGLDPLDIGYAEAALLVAGPHAGRAELHASLEARTDQLDMASHTCLVGLVRARAYVQTGDLQDARRCLATAEEALSVLPEPGILQALSSRTRHIVEAGVDEPLLRPRELEVLRLLATGASRREAAEALHLSVNTVKTYARLAYRTLDVASLRDAIERCEELGIDLSVDARPSPMASV